MWAFSSCGKGRLLFIVVKGFSWWWLLLWTTGFRCPGFSSCGTRLIALQHVGSSQTRD